MIQVIPKQLCCGSNGQDKVTDMSYDSKCFGEQQSALLGTPALHTTLEKSFNREGKSLFVAKMTFDLTPERYELLLHDTTYWPVHHAKV